MTSGAARRLTDRQRAVLERIDRRVPIKVIAQDLGVSETRINQHIRALKNFYEAGSLGELVENYRATLAPEGVDVATGDDAAMAPDPDRDRPLGTAPDAALLNPFSEAAYRKTQINAAPDLAAFGFRDDPGQLVLGDAMPLDEQAPWLRQAEPRVVPGALDGEHAVLLRLGAIVGIATGILASVILAITAAMTLSQATEGKATYSAETSQEVG